MSDELRPVQGFWPGEELELPGMWEMADFMGGSDDADNWCNCQAVPGTVNYPGPWHPKGDPVGCPRYGQS